MKSLSLAGMIGLALLVAGCSTSGTGSARGYEMRIRYAEVTGIERVRLPSAAPAGAVVGGFTGLVLSSGRSTGRQVASGVGGAALGALAVRALEGDRMGYGYTLKFHDSGVSRFITEKNYLQVGDCVSVERGDYANIRRVSDTLCEGMPPSRDVSKKLSADADLCHNAKTQLLAADAAADIEAAARKVEILCD